MKDTRDQIKAAAREAIIQGARGEMSIICPPLYCPKHYTFTVWLQAGGRCPVCNPVISEGSPMIITTEAELEHLAYLVGLGCDQVYKDIGSRRTDHAARLRAKADWGRVFLSLLAARHKGQHLTFLDQAKCPVCGEVRDGSYTGYPT